MQVLIDAYIFIIGVFFGSFLNVLADRLPNEETILGRSHCEHCKHPLAGRDLVPVFSFLIQKGRCRYCHTKLSWNYPLTEVLCGVVFLLVWINPFLTSPALLHLIAMKILCLVIASTLFVMFWADVRYHILPDSMQGIFIVAAALLHIIQTQSLMALGTDLFSGALVMGPILFLFLTTRGRGMGFGDVKLAFGIGFFMGWGMGLLTLYFAFILGGVVGILLILAKRTKMKNKIAFGPFLILSLTGMVIWGNQILTLVKMWFSI